MFEEISMNCRYGYVQVNSKSQELNSSLASQKEESIKKGIPENNIYEEISSAADSMGDRKITKKTIIFFKTHEYYRMFSSLIYTVFEKKIWKYKDFYKSLYFV